MSRANANTGQLSKALDRAKRARGRATGTYSTDTSLLHAARELFALRIAIEKKPDASLHKEACAVDRALTRTLHDAIANSAELALARSMVRHRLSRTERETLLVVILSSMGMLAGIRDVEDIQNITGHDPRTALAVARTLSPGGRLVELGLVEVEDDASEPLAYRQVSLGQETMEQVLGGAGTGRETWGVKTYDEFLDRLYTVFEALRELGRTILVADNAEIQNCFVGQTEKNIVRVFRNAAEDGAVLFWDEADAMSFSRDDAARAWEVRDVSVLLQELERFAGLCILATNRKLSLD